MQSWLVGSSTECDIVVDLPTVSGRHCRVTRTPGGLAVEDLGSANGTFVNGTRINQRTAITRADEIKLGATTPLPWSRLDGSDPDVITIGREIDNDIILDHPSVSGHHARIVRREGRSILEDLGSTNGTSLGRLGNLITRSPLNETDLVYLGTFEIPASRLMGSPPPTPALPSVIRFRGESLIIGGAPDCDQVIDLPMISGRHARVFRSGRRIMIEDLNSSNGTFVNGQRVRTPVEVATRDVIGLGSWMTSLVVELVITEGGSRIEAGSVTVGEGTPGWVSRVSLTIEPGEFVALVGVNGAEASTLLAALAGQVRPVEGEIRIDGSTRNAIEPGSTGFVPRGGSVYGELDPGQAVLLASLLRLDDGPYDPRTRERVSSVLGQLGLVGVEVGRNGGGDLPVRIAAAVELIAGPGAIMLDRPTEELSSEDAQALIGALRTVADGGTTVVVAFDRLPTSWLPKFDLLAVLARDAVGRSPGRLVYFGPAFPEAADCLRLVSDRGDDGVVKWTFGDRPAERASADFAASPFHLNYVARRADRTTDAPDRSAQPLVSRSSWPHQCWAMIRRNLALKGRRLPSTAVILAQGPAIAVLLVFATRSRLNSVLWDDVSLAVELITFSLGLASIWIGMVTSIGDISAERSTFLRERSLGLRVSAYLASKLGVLGSIAVVECLILMVIVHLGCGLKGGWLPMIAVTTCATLVGSALGMVVSAVARSVPPALAALPVIFLALFFLGGGPGMPAQANRLTHFVRQLMPSRWAYEGLLLAESVARPPQISQNPIAPEAVLKPEKTGKRVSESTQVEAPRKSDEKAAGSLKEEKKTVPQPAKDVTSEPTKSAEPPAPVLLPPQVPESPKTTEKGSSPAASDDGKPQTPADLAERAFSRGRNRMGISACLTALGTMFLVLVGWTWVVLIPDSRGRKPTR